MGLAVSRQEAFWEACGFGDKIQVLEISFGFLKLYIGIFKILFKISACLCLKQKY